MNAHQVALALDGFDAEKYWSTREHKVWVVDVSRGRGKQRQRHTMYVRARTQESAASTARENTHIQGKVEATARLATPRDLGATTT